MDLRSLLDLKRRELESRKAEISSLEDEVGTLEKTFVIAERAGIQLDGPGPAAANDRGRARPDRRKKTERKQAPKTGALVEAIRRAVSELPPPFTTGQVRDRINSIDPSLLAKANKTSLASALRRMGEKKQLTVEAKGGPGKEAKYSLPSGGHNERAEENEG